MKVLRIYIDTSVFGGYFDTEFSLATQGFFGEIESGKILPLLSETLAREVEDAPAEIQQLLQKVMSGPCEQLIVGADVVNLARAYLEDKVVSEKYADDALHVALATCARADSIASWNFRHMVNPVRIQAFNRVNRLQNFGAITIMTPEDILRALEESDEEDQ